METTLLHISGTDMNWTVDKMREFIIKDTINLDVRKKAQEITWSIPGREVDLIATEIYDWIKKNIKYQYDPVSEEWVQDSLTTLNLESGDCDDFTVLGASLIRSLGIPAKICFVKIGNEKSFSHVFFEYHSDAKNKWIPFDAIVNRYTGWESPDITEKVVVEIESGKSVKTVGGSTEDLALDTAATIPGPQQPFVAAAAMINNFLKNIPSIKSLSLNNMFGPGQKTLVGVDGSKSSQPTGSDTAKWLNSYIPEKLVAFETAIKSQNIDEAKKIQLLFNRMFAGSKDGSNDDNHFYISFISEYDNKTANNWVYPRAEGGFLYEHSLKPAREIVNKTMDAYNSTGILTSQNQPQTAAQAQLQSAVPQMPPQPQINDFFSNGIPNVQKFLSSYSDIATVRVKLEAFSKSSGKNIPAPVISTNDSTSFDNLNALWIRTNNYRNALLGISDPTGMSYASTGDTPWGTLLLIGAGATKLLGWW